MHATIRRPLKKFAALFREARDANFNEANTVLRICRFFEEVLGYDGLEDISREAEMKGKFVDICLKVDGHVRLLVEVKAASVKLRDRHIEQAQSYASRNNFRWVLLTNGVDWHLYHLTFDEGIEYEKAFVVSLDGDDAFDEATCKLELLHKKVVSKGGLEAYWDKETALGPASLSKALFQNSVLRLIRREVRRDTGILVDTEDLAHSLNGMFSAEAREQIGPLRIRRKRRKSRPSTPTSKAPNLNTTPPTPDGPPSIARTNNQVKATNKRL